MTKLVTPGPRLQALIEADYAYLGSDGNVFGIASDGEEVLLGNRYTFPVIEQYLADFPTPEHW